MSSNWIDNNSSIIPSWNGLSVTSNKSNKTYIQGFLDVSGGNIILRNGGLYTQTDISCNGTIYGKTLTVSGNANISGALSIGKITNSYALDISGQIYTNNFIYQQPIYFRALYTTGSGTQTAGVPLSSVCTLSYQNLGGFSTTSYGFHNTAVGSIPAGAFIAPITGVYSFNVNMREVDNANVSSIYPAINTGGVESTLWAGHIIFKPTDGTGNRRSACVSNIIQLTQGQGFYYTCGVGGVGGLIDFIEFSGTFIGLQ